MEEKDRVNKEKLVKLYFTTGEVAKEINRGKTSVVRYADYLDIPLRNGRRLFTTEDMKNIRKISLNKYDLSDKGLFLAQQVAEQTQLKRRLIDWYAVKLHVLHQNKKFYFTQKDIETMLSRLNRNSDLSAKGLFSTRQVAEKTGKSLTFIIHCGVLLNLPLKNRRYYFTQENIDEILSRIEKTKDKTGKQAGYLTAIRDTGKRKLMRNGWYSAIWEWQCRCGNKVERALMEVRDKRYGSCGCRSIETGKKHIELARAAAKIYDGVNVATLETKKLRSNNTSGVRGVSFIKRYQKYEAYIRLKGHSIYLGRYETLEEAKEVRQKAEKKYFQPYIDGYKKQQKQAKKNKIGDVSE